MIVPGSIGDWMLFASMLGALSALAVSGYRWVLQETVTPVPIRTDLVAPRTTRQRVPT